MNASTDEELEPRELSRRLRRAVVVAGAQPDQWEASVRSERGRIVPGERVMIERAGPAVCRAVFDALGIALPGEASALLALAERTSVQLIAGWDLGRGAPVAKLYLNASDRGADLRAELARAIGWNGLERLGAPHILAINARAESVLRKAYVQAEAVDDGVEAAFPLTVPPALAAGAVLSWELPPSGPPIARAGFVAIRDRDDGSVETFLAGWLAGWDPASLAAALPFERGHCRSVGVDREGASVAYFKPRGAGVPLDVLEPAARFAHAGHDVAVFVEEKREGVRAFATTERSAISFRGAEEIPRELVSPLHAWVVERVSAAEREGVPIAEALEGPPAPWQRERDTAHGRLVEASADDRYFDYCLQPYQPRRTWRGGLRGETLLWESLAVAGATSDLALLLDRVREHAGKDATVWGTKHIGGRLSWELYFYDPLKEHVPAHVASLVPVLAPLARCSAPIREDVPYMMWSFDLLPTFRRGADIDAINYYLAEPVGQAGRSYKATAAGIELENVYHFFHPKLGIAEVLSRVRSSVVVDFTKVDLAKVIFPELFTCQKICVAKKRTADAVYYSGITVQQLLWFLGRFHYPAELVAFVRAHEVRFEHLRFDVGVDYFTGPGREIATPKTSFYSSL